MAQPAESSMMSGSAAIAAVAAALVFLVLWWRFLQLLRLRRTMLRIYGLSEDVFRARDAEGMLAALQKGFPLGLGLYPEGILLGPTENRLAAGRRPGADEVQTIPMVVEGQRYGALACRRMGRGKPLKAEEEALQNLANQVGAVLRSMEEKAREEASS